MTAHVLFIVLVCLLLELEYVSRTFYVVVRVVDVDTIDVRAPRSLFRKTTVVRIRLKGVWGPELHHPRTRAMPSGKRCAEWLRTRLLYRRVRIIRHGKEKYGRELGTVLGLDGTNWNEKIVARGYAFGTYEEQEQWMKDNKLKKNNG